MTSSHLKAELFDMQWKEFIFFAGLVATTAFIFKFMTRNYVLKDQYAKIGGAEAPLLHSTRSAEDGGGSGSSSNDSGNDGDDSRAGGVRSRGSVLSG